MESEKALGRIFYGMQIKSNTQIGMFELAATHEDNAEARQTGEIMKKSKMSPSRLQVNESHTELQINEAILNYKSMKPY